MTKFDDRYIFDDIYSRVDTMHQRDVRTDRQTDRQRDGRTPGDTAKRRAVKKITPVNVQTIAV